MQNYATPETVHTLVQFLSPKPEHLYPIRDLLYIITSYETREQMLTQHLQIFFIYIQGIFHSKKKDYDFVVSLHALIDCAIKEKAYLIGCNSEKNIYKFECCEQIISYCLHILLSINWNLLFNPNGNGGNVPQKRFVNPGNVLLAINFVFSKAETESENLYTFLHQYHNKGSNDFAEEAILLFLFNRLYLREDNSKEKYEKGYLGERTYMCLLCHLTQDSSCFNSAEKEVIQKIWEMKRSEIENARFQIIYAKIIYNLMAFEKPVQEIILLDFIKLSSKPILQYFFIKSELIIESTLRLLCRKKYLSNAIIKSNLENHFNLLASSIYNGKQKKEFMYYFFKEMRDFPKEEILNLYNQILDQLFIDPIRATADDGIYFIIQLVYLLEDTANSYNEILNQEIFIEIVGKLEIFLSEINMIYFWYPSFLQKNLSLDNPFNAENNVQREGGIVRILLKLLFGIIAKTSKGICDESLNKFVMKLLTFFIFQKRSTLEKLAKRLNLSHLPSLKEKPKIVQPENFIEFASKGSFAKNKLKLIIHDKTIVQQKTVEEISKIAIGKKDLLESNYSRTIWIITQITEVLLYSIFEVDSYIEMSSEQKELPKVFNYRVNYLTKLLGRVLKTIAKSPGWCQTIIESSKDLINAPKYKFENYFSNFDFLSKEKIELMRPKIQQMQTSKITRFQSLCPSPKKGSEQQNVFTFSNLQAFQDEFGKDLPAIHEYYCHFINKNISVDKYSSMVIEIITSKGYLNNVQTGLHTLTTEDYILIDRVILPIASVKNVFIKKKIGPKKLSKE